MKGSFLWKLMFLFCALAGCLAGYGFFHLVNEGIVSEYLTKDNTLVRESENSVLFDAEKLLSDMGKEIENQVDELMKKQEDKTKESPEGFGLDLLPYSAQTEENKIAGEKAEDPEKKTGTENAETDGNRTNAAEIKDTAEVNSSDAAISTAGNGIEASSEEEEKIDAGALSEAKLLDGLSGKVIVPETIPAEAFPGTDKVQEMDSQSFQEKQEEVELVFTYPAEIFGQVPVINRSDAYVTYFEFAHDLIELIEPEVKRRDMNETALFAQFALKAFFCGVKIQNLDINAPISRKEAALTLWLAADVMGEDGSNTSARSAENYATDVKNCSGSEKKAIAYLYEQGILSGYQIGNQTFEPEDYLTTEIGENWLIRAGQCWK